MGDRSQRTIEELAALSPNERLEVAKAGIVRSWDDLECAEQEHIQATASELRKRLG